MLVQIIRTFRPLFFVLSTIYFRLVTSIFSLLNQFRCKHSVKRPMNNLLMISAKQAAQMIRNREITCSTLVEAYIQRINEVNGIINAVVENNFKEALLQAVKIDNTLSCMPINSEESRMLAISKPLLGVPFTIKDCIEIGGFPCTVGIPYRKGMKSSEDAIVVQRMKDAGAILLAITNVPELCMWWETINGMHGRTKNPYDSRRISGGSSGGESALIAAAGSVVGIGSDIAGSIRMPAFFNGVFGLKPTSGLVPLTGHLPQIDGYRIEMLRIGPICRFAEDLSLMLKVLVGNDDSLLKFDDAIELKKVRLFYMEGLKTPLVQSLDKECLQTMKKAIRYLEMKYDLCAVRVDLKFVHYALEFFYINMQDPNRPTFAMYLTDLKSELNCLMELIKWVFGMSLHTLPAIATGIVDKHFNPFNEEEKIKLLAQRDRLIRELNELLADDAVLIFPSFPSVAPYHNQPLFTPLNFGYSALWNILGLPAVQCPMGLNKNGLPLGIQVIGASGSDRLLMAIAESLEYGFGGWRPTN